MGVPASIPIALWTWAVLATPAVGYTLYSLAQTIFEPKDDPLEAATQLLALATLIGLIACPMALLGHPWIALWTCRIVAGIGTCAGFYLAIRSFIVDSPRPSPWGIPALCAAEAYVLALAAFSVLLHPAMVPVPQTAGLMQAAPVAFKPIDFWHSAALIILAVALLVSLFSFTRAVRQEGSLSFESNWGGLGGGIGGWQASSSLTYLLAVVCFGSLFLALALHDDKPPAVSPPAPAQSAATESK